MQTTWYNFVLNLIERFNAFNNNLLFLGKRFSLFIFTLFSSKGFFFLFFCDRLLLFSNLSTISPNYNKVYIYSHKFPASPFQNTRLRTSIIVSCSNDRNFRSKTMKNSSRLAVPFLRVRQRKWRTVRKHLFSTTCITVHKKVMRDAK